MIIIRKTNKIILLSFIIFFFVIGNVYAGEIVSAQINISYEYITWQNLPDEEKENIPAPSMYAVDVSEEVLKQKANKIKFTNIIGKYTTFLNELGSPNATDSSYILTNDIDIDVRDQAQTQCCWAIAVLTSMETNMKKTENKDVNLSERHLDYATSEDFYDGVNPNAFQRSVTEGGNTPIGLAYLTNGQGAVLEEEMEFVNDMNTISLKEIDIDPSIYVTGYRYFPAIYKGYNLDGSVYYYDESGTVISKSDVDLLRNDIKEHIIKYGGVVAYTASSKYEYYSSSDVISSENYFCNDTSVGMDHAFTIVGWDDTYSRENFTGKAKPSTDGAYIVLNSYSEYCFNDGYLYVSYEDVNIETSLYGITSTSEINYDNLYQYDNFGSPFYITPLTATGTVPTEIYYSSTYTRDNTKSEQLNSISLSTNKYCSFEIYINPNGDNLNVNEINRITVTQTLSPGYHTITFDPILLTGDKFSVIIKEVPIDGVATLMIEPQIDGTFYEYVTSNIGDSKISLNGVNWQNLADLGVISSQGLKIDLTKSDVCIKAFTTIVEEEKPEEEPDVPATPEKTVITSEKYEITEDKFITKIYDNNKISDVLKNISVNKTYKVFNSNGEEITNFETLIATNMYMQIENDKYYFAVRGDINGDGKISLIDLSKHIACYAELEGYGLDGAYKKACDISLDGKFSLIDVSQFLVLINNM